MVEAGEEVEGVRKVEVVVREEEEGTRGKMERVGKPWEK